MTIRSTAIAALLFTLGAVVVIVLNVSARSLTPLALLLTFGAWWSFAVLGRAALQRPRIGALTERAFIAFIIAVLGSVACAIAVNTDSGRPWFDAATASLLFRLAIIAVLAVPTLWLVLWLTGRLGQGD